MEIRVLGPVRAVRADADIALGGPRQRRLLSVLLLGDGRVVEMHRIVAAVWGDAEPPSGASRTVLSYLSRLRSSLGDGHVSTRDEGYVLVRGDLSVDADRFTDLVRVAAVASPAQALPLLDEALSLWYGRAFGELADEDWCRPRAVRLEELRLVAIEARAQARLDLGLHAEALPELEQLVVEHPLRERFRAQLMVALFRSGRHAEALRSFQVHRRLMADEMGLEPSSELVDLDRRIASSDPSLQFVVAGRTKRGYVLADVIGEGAFGTVYRASQPCVGREVAVKVVRQELADDPDYVRRFEGEARLVARLEHPHIVPLYDFWREPGAAYLVFRFLRGGSVETASLTARQWTIAAVSRLVEEIGSALNAAHNLGIVHGDVKPANVLFDDVGNAYLTDFGIATESVGAPVLPGRRSYGSLQHTSPEQIDAGVATTRSDQYSLAVMAWELLTGWAPFVTDSVAETLDLKLRRTLRPLQELRPDLPSAVGEVLCRAAAVRPEDRFRSMPEFLADWRSATAQSPAAEITLGSVASTASSSPSVNGRVTGALLAPINPYKGLRAFDEADSRDFHGRDGAIDELSALVNAHRFVTVVGPSGSGKSSLVRSGLTPRLRDEHRLVALALPGTRPLEAIAEALTQVAVEHPVGLSDCFVDPTQLARTIDSLLPPGDCELVLILDQFEELWTLADPDTRDRLLDALAAAARAADSRLRIVTTVRADFYDRPLSNPVIGVLVEQASLPLAPLSPAGLERAMSAPAARVGVRLEPALAAELIADVSSEPAGLPLLQYALTELFEQREADTMTLATYTLMGGLAGPLISRAEAIHDSFSEDELPQLRRLFARLVTPGDGTPDTRRRARRSELRGIEPSVIDRYGTARLLTFDVDPINREPTVEVAHEALIQHWPRLRAWLDEDREGIRVHRHLSDAAATWTARGGESGDLYRGARLHAALEWAAGHPDDASPIETTFLQEAQRRTRAARRRNVSAVALLVVFLVASLVAAWLAVVAAHTAEAERTTSDLRRLAFEAQATASSQPDLAMLLAVEAYRRLPGVDSESALYASLVAQPGIRRFIPLTLPDGKTVESIIASNDGLIALELDGSVMLLDASSLRPTRVMITTGTRSTIAFNRAGNELATSTQNGEIRRWDPRTGREVAPIVHVQAGPPGPVGPPIAYLADGSLVVVDHHAVVAVAPASETRVWTAEIPVPAQSSEGIGAIAVSPSGRAIAVSWTPTMPLATGALGLLDTSDRSFRPVPWTLGVPNVMRFADDHHLYVLTPREDFSGQVGVVDVDHAALQPRVGELASIGTDLVTLPDGGALVALFTGGLVRVRADMGTGERIELPGPVWLTELDDGTVLGTLFGRLVEIDPDERSAVARPVRSGPLTATGLIAGTDDRLLLLRSDSKMVVVDATTLRPVSPPLTTTDPLVATIPATLSPDASRVALSNPDRVELIDVAAGHATLPPFTVGSYDPPAFSPDGRLLLVGGADGKLHEFDVDTGAERWSRDFGGGPVGSVRFSPDGLLITAKPFQEDIRILDATTGAAVSGPFPSVSSLAFSPTGGLALAAGAELELIDARTGKVVRTLNGNQGLLDAGYIDHGRWINAITGSGLFELIDSQSGARVGVPLRVARDAYSDVSGIAFTTTGIYYGRVNGPISYYDFDPAAWVVTACKAAGRNLTRAEWRSYLGSLANYGPTCPQYPTEP